MARRFGQSFGRAPHAYLVERRIEGTNRLLAQAAMPVMEVASAFGFADRAHMTRVFHAHLHTTPAALRRGDATPQTDRGSKACKLALRRPALQTCFAGAGAMLQCDRTRVRSERTAAIAFWRAANLFR